MKYRFRLVVQLILVVFLVSCGGLVDEGEDQIKEYLLREADEDMVEAAEQFAREADAAVAEALEQATREADAVVAEARALLVSWNDSQEEIVSEFERQSGNLLSERNKDTVREAVKYGFCQVAIGGSAEAVAERLQDWFFEESGVRLEQDFLKQRLSLVEMSSEEVKNVAYSMADEILGGGC